MTRLIHVTTIPLTLGFVDAQVEPMRARGYELEVVSSPGALLDAFARRHGVVAHAVEMSRAIRPGSDLRALAQLSAVFRHRLPEIVHAHTPKAGLLAMVAAAASQVPARVYGMRGLLTLTATGARRRLYVASERVACAAAHAVVCESPSLREAALAQDLVDPAKARVVANGGNGVDAAHFDPASWASRGREVRARHGLGEGPVIGFVGRLARDKGVADLVHAWTRLRVEVPTSRLLLVGPEEERDRLPAPVLARIRDDPRICTPGFIDEVAAYYAAMDVFVLPSLREGLPNSVLEASAMALPVVTTRATGCVDALVDDVTGTLVEPRSPGALARALRRYLRDPDLRRRHGEQARAWVQGHHDPAKVHAGLDRLYRELLAAPGGKAAGS